ncbi:Crp/Fnr family transcriptional regulator [Chloroflexota bacterium]
MNAQPDTISSDTLAERLKNVIHFKNLPLRDRLDIVRAGQMRYVSADTVIFSEEEPCSGMYVLLRGHVHLCKLGPQGQENILADLDPVIMFNEVSLLDGGPNPYTAIADKNSLIWKISLENYEKLLMRYANEPFMQVSLGLLRIMAGRYRQLIDHYADLSFLTVPVRLAKLIFELSEQGQHSINRQNISISEMAARISTVPEAISRGLNFLKCQGVINTDRLTISITDREELSKIAQIDQEIMKSF